MTSRIYAELPKKKVTMVTILLDMRFHAGHQKARLSFRLNDQDCGVAFDDIDINKEYCLGMSLYWCKDGWEIIE